MTDLVIVGGGPSGLAAAYEAIGRGAKPAVLERLDCVGGLARTTSFQGNRFDIGPHRFFTKNREVQALFMRMAAEDLLFVPRLTRILCDRTYFNYPLTPLNALFGVGPQAGVSILSSYISVRAPGAPSATHAILSKTGWSPISAAGFMRCSSRPIPRRSGAFLAQKLVPIGRRSASRA